MESSTKDRREKKTGILDGLPHFISYRNRADDPVLQALENAAKQLKAEGKPLIRKDDET